MEDIAKLIIGPWRLVHSISVNSKGEKEYPYGDDAIGYIYYSDSGIMAVQISRKSRDKAADPSNLIHEYLAYFGRYEINTETQVVRHLLEGELFPLEGELISRDHSRVLERRYHFEGDLMSLNPVDGTNREILWQRVRNE
jgi:Lipocalin-like domain